MEVRVPSPAELREVAKRIGLSLDEAELGSFIELMAPNIDYYNQVEAMPDELPEVRHPRDPGHRPEDGENPHNAWYVKTAITGAAEGKLKGKRIALKDNIMLAEVPMMVGASILEGYVPEIDATVVTRMLDAGGEIAGKAHTEYLCLSGGSHTNATGPVHNPHKRGYSCGGSSSGSAALVAAGEVDMALGGDQGGSIRIPASFCGVYGLKPTHGLVPYTGILPIEVTVDHVGPMSATVADNAILLEVLAGPDAYDPRQRGGESRAYVTLMAGGVSGMKIGVVKEGFGHPGAEAEVETKVRAAAERLAALGAEVAEVSIPMHLEGEAIWTPIILQGLTETMMWTDGFGIGRNDLFVGSLTETQRSWRDRGDELPDSVKAYILLGTYIRDTYGTRHYGKAINVARRLGAAYDAVLAEDDLLLMPTVPVKAPPLPSADAGRTEYLRAAHGLSINTAPFNITHHPAMSVPCGMAESLPIGMMLIARHFDEATMYRAAHAFEQAGDWRRM